MTIEEIKELVAGGYSPVKNTEYRKAYNVLFHPKKASTCNCSIADIYNKVVAEVSKPAISNTIVKPSPVVEQPVSKTAEVAKTALTDEEFIMKVKNQLITGWYDTELVTKAYQLIIKNPNEIANVKVMRTTILNYNLSLN